MKKRYKHFHRLRVIGNTFAKHGLGFLFDYLGLRDALPIIKRFEPNGKSQRLAKGERIRLVFEELGTTFIKLGQVLSTRSDFLPDDIIMELEKLQDGTTTYDFYEIEEVITQELGASIGDLFLNFDPVPIAAASIAQVHKAELGTGQKVVVKVQRPNLLSEVETDLEILFDLARLADRRTAMGERLQFTNMVEEFTRTLNEEMDFRVEGRNAERIKHNFRKDDRIHIPFVHWDYTSARVLTTDMLEGVKLGNIEELSKKGFDKSKLADNLLKIMLEQILLDGFFHGDPHPGNIFALKGGRLGFIDFGVVGRLDEERKNQLTGIIISLVNKDSDALVHHILEMGITPPDMRKNLLKKDISEFRDKHYNKLVTEISLRDVFNDLFRIVYKYNITMPSDFILLSKTMVITEGIVRVLDPQLSVVEVMESFAGTLAKRRFSPENI
ncbi:MAG: hypothetical protein GX318_08190, partial [Clostridia bacterium]|nr:hypothetical protein [Clostridia bacterium]